MSIYVDIKKKLGTFTLEVAFEAGSETLSLLGGSGCGKSMTLRCIAGIVTPDEGVIRINDRVVFDSAAKINLKPQKRNVGYLFQNYALFPNMTVLQNIMTGLERKKGLSRAERRSTAQSYADRLQLQGLEGRFPSQLSGGQQQRTALARILASDPDLLLLDEPFSALDSYLREKTEQEVRGIIKEFSGTAILVSHNRDEVFRMADRIAVYNNGHIDAFGEKHEVFRNPRTYTAALLTGCKNFSPVSHLRTENGRTYFRADEWGLDLVTDGEQAADIVGLRRHYAEASDTEDENTFRMDIVDTIESTFEYTLFLRRSGTTGTPFEWSVSKDEYNRLPSKSDILLHFPNKALMLLKK